MKLKGYLVADYYNDQMHYMEAYTKKEEAEKAFRDAIEFYDSEITEEEMKKYIAEGYYTNGDSCKVYLEELNKIRKTR